MASIVKGTIGDQPVELNNAATESTLLQMLALAKQDSAVLRNMAAKAGVDAKAIEKASKNLEQQNKASADAGGSLTSLAPKASLLGGFLMDMGASAMKTMGNLVEFGDELMEGKARASDFFKALKDLPLGLGLLATVFQKAMQYQERNLDVYRQISSTGAGLNGSLAELRTKASGLYLTLDEFANVMKTNGDTFKSLGGSASAGSEAFININRRIMKSGLGDNLLNMGYSFEQVNNLLGGYLRVSGDGLRIGRDSAKEQERLAKAAANYGKELDFMARLQGESREALEQKMQAEAQEASWQLHLAQMDEEGREKANMALMRANAVGGKGAMDALKASIMGFAAPFSEEGKNFVSLFGAGTKAIETMARTVKDGTKAEEASGKLDKLMAQAVAGNIRDMKGLQNVINAMGLGGTDMARGIMDVVKANTEYIKTGRVSAEEIEKAIQETKRRQAADQKAADAANQNEKRMKELGNQINQALMPVMELLARYGNRVVGEFMKFINTIDLPKLGQELAKFMEGVMNYAKNLFSEEGRTKIMNDIKHWFQLLLVELKLALIPWYTEADAEEERKRLTKDKEIYDARAKSVEELKEIARLEARQKLLENTDSLKTINQAIQNDQEKLKALKENKDLSDEEKRTQQEEINRRIKANQENKQMLERLDDTTRTQALNETKARIARMKASATLATAGQETYRERRTRESAEINEQQAAIDAMGANPMGVGVRHGGSIGATGNVLENFGTGTRITAGGKEGMLTEQQMTNLAKGSADTGAAQAQERLANAIIALNKSQAMTNQLLAQSVEYQRRYLEGTSRFGNQFARAY